MAKLHPRHIVERNAFAHGLAGTWDGNIVGLHLFSLIDGSLASPLPAFINEHGSYHESSSFVEIILGEGH